MVTKNVLRGMKVLRQAGNGYLVVLEGGSLEHDLLALWLDPGEGVDLRLEHQRLLGRVDLHVGVELLAPFHLD